MNDDDQDADDADLALCWFIETCMIHGIGDHQIAFIASERIPDLIGMIRSELNALQ